MKHKSSGRAVRVVIDTNVLVSALIFKAGRIAGIREAWERGICTPLVSRATTRELMRVLQYPKFELSQTAQGELLAAYLPYCETLALPKTRLRLPRCRDHDDEPFLLLAAAGKADVLVSGDKDLLAVKGNLPFAILPPAEFLEHLAAREQGTLD